MAGTNGGSPPDLNIDLKLSLLKEGSSYSFYQAIRLLRQYTAVDSSTQNRAQQSLDAIKIVPNLSLAFPAADVETIEEIDDSQNGNFKLTANFLGLYGSSSPLPTFYTEDLINESGDEEYAAKDFIDIIHQRLYKLLFKSWLKYRQFQQISEEKDTAHLERLFCLLGLGEKIYREDFEDPYQLLRYIGLFSQSPRSAMGLKTLLEDALDIPIEVIPNVHRKAKIPDDQRIQLGNPEIRLGQDSFLGQELEDRMGKFRLKIGPLDEPAYRSFFPGSKLYNKLVSLTDLFVTDPLDYDIDVSMASAQAQTVCLGGSEWASLGLDTWIFSGHTAEETTSRFYPHS
jgi:type VI secretion system protein ImpH